MVQKVLIVVLIALSTVYFSGCTSSMAAVPADLVGVSIGMSRDDAERQLSKVGKLDRLEKGRQQIWRLDKDPRFGAVAIGLDKDDKVRYVTAFVDPSRAAERITFSSVGDIAKARSEVSAQHHRYVWENASAGYDINVYGDGPEFVTIYTLVKHSASTAAKEEEDD